MERETKKSQNILSKAEVIKLMPQLKGQPELADFYDIIKLFPKKKAIAIIESLMQKKYT